jgi:hypothetical protein
MKTIKFLLSYLFDFIAVGGILAVIHGIAMVHGPSAWIVGGLLVLAFSVFISYFDGKVADARRGR